MALDDDAIERRRQLVLAQHRLLKGEGGPGVGHHRAGDVDFGARDHKFGRRDILVALRLVGRLLRDDAAADQRLLAPVGLATLGEDRPGAGDICLGLAHVHFGAEQSGLGARHARLLFGRTEPGEDVAPGHRIAVIRGHFGQGGADLEADPRDDARLDGAETEHPDGNILGNGYDRDGNGPDGDEEIAGRRNDGQHRKDCEHAQSAFLFAHRPRSLLRAILPWHHAQGGSACSMTQIKEGRYAVTGWR